MWLSVISCSMFSHCVCVNCIFICCVSTFWRFDRLTHTQRHLAVFGFHFRGSLQLFTWLCCLYRITSLSPWLDFNTSAVKKHHILFCAWETGCAKKRSVFASRSDLDERFKISGGFRGKSLFSIFMVDAHMAFYTLAHIYSCAQHYSPCMLRAI